MNFSGESCTLIIRNVDEPGRIMEVAAALSKAEINVATMQVFRDKRGGNGRYGGRDRPGDPAECDR